MAAVNHVICVCVWLHDCIGVRVYRASVSVFVSVSEMVAAEFRRATISVSVFVSVFVIIAAGFLRAAVSVSEIVAGWLRTAGSVSVSVFVSEIVAGWLRAAVSVSVSISKIAPGFLGTAVSVSVSEISPGFLRAAVPAWVSVWEVISPQGLAVGIDSSFENCSHGHFSGLGGKGRSLLRGLCWASFGTGLAFKPGRGRL
jgi:hypothetical protein